MKWSLLILLLLAVSASAATVRLYLKDGSYQIVREYQVVPGEPGQPDRVKYLSAERSGDWEEIPFDLVDLDRTKKVIAEHETHLALEARLDAEEDNAIRAEKRRAASVSEDPGAYYIDGEMLEALEQADVTVVSDKTRTLLRTLSEIAVVVLGQGRNPPTPLVSNKSTFEVQGVAASFRIENQEQPEFFFRLAQTQDGFTLVKLSPKGNSRIVETVFIAPVTNELSAKREPIPTFTKQHGETLYKIWPEKSLPPGEYALIEFEDARGILQVWDFGVGDRWR
jgi:hypothetical protein